MEPHSIEDIERIAWFARLAMGDNPEIDTIPPQRAADTTSVFNVIP